MSTRFASRASALFATLVVLAVPASASATSSWTTYADDADNDVSWWQGHGDDKISIENYSNPSVNATGFRVSAFNSQRQTDLTFSPPTGQRFVPGAYDGVAGVNSPLRNNRPAMEGQLGCDRSTGSFEIKDIAYDAAGVPNRLWLLYNYRCDGAPRGTFGEIRLNEPDPVKAVPQILRSGESDAGFPGRPHPVTFVGPLAAGATAVTGDAGFKVVSDGCGGKAIAAGESCAVTVSFSSAAPGTHTGTLTGPGGVGVPLQAWMHGGTTRLQLTSDAGDPIGRGQNYAYGPDTFAAGLGPAPQDQMAQFAARVELPWSGRMQAAGNAPLAVGSYKGATSLPSDSTPFLDVSGQGTSCESTGDFTVTELTREASGVLKTFAATFNQRCTRDATGSLHGTVQWRAGDTARPAPWMTGEPETPPTGQPPAPTTPASSDPCAAAAFAKAKVRTGTKRSNRIRGSRKSEIIRAGAGNDIVRAGGGADCVDGGAGRDRIDGGAGNDVLIGGSGRDVIICGAGKDMAIVGPGDRTRGCEVKVRVSR